MVSSVASSHPETSGEKEDVGSITFQVNDSSPLYRAAVIYDEESPGLACTLVVTEDGDEKPLQTIVLSENERFSQQVAYAVDVTFDGNADLLIPDQLSASGAYFQAYIWNASENGFVYAPSFENLPNIAVDKENEWILSSRTADKITSYAMSRYDENKKDFTVRHTLYWEPGVDEGTICFVEQSVKESGNLTTDREGTIEGSDPLSIDQTDGKIAGYFQAGSFWNLNDDRWKNTVYKP